MNIPEEWLEKGEHDEDSLDTRAFYEIMQMYRHSGIAEACQNYEDVKTFIRANFEEMTNQEITEVMEQELVRLESKLTEYFDLGCEAQAEGKNTNSIRLYKFYRDLYDVAINTAICVKHKSE